MIMKETPVNKIMENTLEKMRQMVDTSTIIGEPMVTGTTTLIPVSKVSYGFTSGGTDLPSKQNQELFGGGGGGGITITPVAFIVIENGKYKKDWRFRLSADYYVFENDKYRAALEIDLHGPIASKPYTIKLYRIISSEKVNILEN